MKDIAVGVLVKRLKKLGFIKQAADVYVNSSLGLTVKQIAHARETWRCIEVSGDYLSSIHRAFITYSLESMVIELEKRFKQSKISTYSA